MFKGIESNQKSILFICLVGLNPGVNITVHWQLFRINNAIKVVKIDLKIIF